MNATSDYPGRPLTLLRATFAAFFVSIAVFSQAKADLAFTVTDLGTLGGAASQANGVAGNGANAAGMVVGSSTMSDNSEHAFLYTNGQMFDLNVLCDLSQSDFKVLTVATSISDSCLIIGGGITTNGQKHAFLLTPVSVAGGNWSYNCCQWVWIQQGGGWWWEENCGCYRWHGERSYISFGASVVNDGDLKFDSHLAFQAHHCIRGSRRSADHHSR